MSDKFASASKSSLSSSESTSPTASGAMTRSVLMAGQVWDVRDNKAFTEGPNSGKKENWRPHNLFLVEETILTNSNGERKSFPKLVKVKSHLKVEIGCSIVAKVRVTSFDGNEYFTLENVLDDVAADALRKAGVV